MNAALLLGLIAACGYGLTDYLARIAGQAVGVWRSLFYGDLLGLVALSLWMVFAPDAASHARGDAGAWVAAVVSGFVLLAAAALLTQGLTRGTLAVVAPVTASYGAIAAALAAASGERLAGKAIAGVCVTVLGVCLVSVPRGGRSELRRHLHASGFGWAIAAALCYGVGFWMQGEFAVPSLGPFLPVWLSYVIVVATVPLLRRPLRLSMLPPSRAQLPPVLGAGLFSTAAYLALTLGLATTHVAIVVVISTLASAVTVLLSKLLDGAPVVGHQWAAIGAIACGLILIKS